MTRWTDALKKWNAEHNPGKWCVPRKGSEGHAQVKALMGPAPPKKGKEAKPEAEHKAESPAAPAPHKGFDIRSFMGAKAKAKESSKPGHPEKPGPGEKFKIKPKVKAVKEVVKEAVNEVVEAPKSHRDMIIELLSTELVKKKVEPAKSAKPAAEGHKYYWAHNPKNEREVELYRKDGEKVVKVAVAKERGSEPGAGAVHPSKGKVSFAIVERGSLVFRAKKGKPGEVGDRLRPLSEVPSFVRQLEMHSEEIKAALGR